MQPYIPGKPIEEVQRELGLTDIVKLASNENPLGPSPRALEAVRQAAETMHLYPDAAGFSLRTKIAEKNGLPADYVMIGNGSDELIHLLGLVFLAPGDQMVVGDPTFVRYHAAGDLADVEIIRVPLNHDWKHDLARMAASATERTKLAFVANPHNPTGTVLTQAEIDAFRRDLPEDTVLVLDEAYREYALDLPDFPDAVQMIRRGQAVISLRTFSKAYGLAGIRVGYGLAHPDIVDAVNRAREPFDVNRLAQAAAVAALDDDEYLARSRQVNGDGLARITAAVEGLGFHVIPSRANFICIDLGRPAHPVFEELLRAGIIVRSGQGLGMPNHLRVSIGTPEEITRFLTAFTQIVTSAAVAT